MAFSLSREMNTNVNTDEKPVNISTQSKTSEETSVCRVNHMIMYIGMENSPTRRSAMAKLISKK